MNEVDASSEWILSTSEEIVLSVNEMKKSVWLRGILYEKSFMMQNKF